MDELTKIKAKCYDLSEGNKVLRSYLSNFITRICREIDVDPSSETILEDIMVKLEELNTK